MAGKVRLKVAAKLQPKTAVRPGSAAAPSSLRDEHRRITRERLVSAANELFKTQGFRATTVENIARMAGTTVTTFYRYFNSKSELVHLLQEQLSLEMAAVVQPLDSIAPTREAVRLWMNSYYAMWKRTHVLCDAYWEAVGADAELASDTIPEGLRLTAQLPRLIGRFEAATRDEAQLRVTTVILTLDRVCLLVQCENRPAEKSAVLDAYTEVLWQTLFGQREAPCKRK
ncbi:TetR/AcrR family transcriptional regulator [Solimonas soli]|uniref:TetR/AcrR family transcriptional regulator n=1 Tax=Solimonas soli TaxID=413479 RepID=UPI0004ADDBB5|nr:TetR/AcrR family transcriptional regulator [Solimonas soli]